MEENLIKIGVDCPFWLRWAAASFLFNFFATSCLLAPYMRTVGQHPEVTFDEESLLN